MTTGSTSGGSFVTPQYLVGDWARYRTNPPTFVSQATRVDDTGAGMAMYVPAFNTSASVAQQVTQGTTVANSSPAAGYLSANLITIAGEVDLSQPLLDRGGPIGFDKVLHAELAGELATQVDSYALTEALATAGSVTSGSVFAVPAFFEDIAKARKQMTSTAGVNLEPTALFMDPIFGNWALAQSDSSNRPLAVPTPPHAALPIQLGPDGSAPYGATGYQVLGTTALLDGNIAASVGTSDAQIILASMPEVYVLQSEPVLRVIPETLAADLEVTVQLVSYIGVIVRYGAAVQVITGAAYPSSPTYT